MTALANYAENLLIDWMLTAGAATRPTAWYLALHTADPTETGATGELSGNGYARQSIAFDAAASGATANSGQITFGPNTGSNWGTVTHSSVWTASTSGNCLFKGALTASKSIAVGDSLIFAIGDVDFSLD
jgi:hypothetical protein